MGCCLQRHLSSVMRWFYTCLQTWSTEDDEDDREDQDEEDYDHDEEEFDSDDG